MHISYILNIYFDPDLMYVLIVFDHAVSKSGLYLSVIINIRTCNLDIFLQLNVLTAIIMLYMLAVFKYHIDLLVYIVIYYIHKNIKCINIYNIHIDKYINMYVRIFNTY